MFQPVDVCQRAFLRFDQVFEHRTRCTDGRRRVAIEAESFQRQSAKMPGERFAGRLRIERPAWPPRDQNPPGRYRDFPTAIVGQQAFAGGDAGQFVGQSVSRKARGLKTAGGKIDPGNSGLLAADVVSVGRGIIGGRNHGGQIIARPRVEQGVVGHGAGADDARQLAFDQALGLAWGLRPVRTRRHAGRRRSACPGSFPTGGRENRPSVWRRPLFRDWLAPD